MDSSTGQAVEQTAGAGASGPDWGKVGEEICCPLCDYNLRGISEARCPECGYRFEWSELLGARRNHPYLFEQARRRYVKSFVKTLVRNGEPGMFWKTLRPNMPTNRAGLILYWLICAGLGSLPAIVTILFPIGRRWWATVMSPRNGTQLPMWPPPRTWGLDFEQLLDRHADVTLMICGGMALFPLLTAGSLMLFRQSMHRAKVLPEHVMRVAIYSADAIVWNGVWIMLAMLAQMLPFRPLTPIMLYEIGVLLTIIFTTRRIAAGYADYMRFPDPVATALLSQFVVLLSLAVLWIPLFREMFLNRM